MIKHFSSGLLAGGLIAAIGLTVAISDDRTRKRLAKSSKRAVQKAGDIIGTVADRFD
jgi:hypothetical protein